jgi:hypothetical protein
MISQRNISLLSNRLAREGGRRIPEEVLERDYCLAWFLVSLAGSPICKSLMFKGGTALKRCYFSKYRFSEDLDFTLAEEMPLETILAGFEEVYAEVRQSSGVVIRYSRKDRRKHQSSYTFYLAYEGPLPGVSKKEFKVDITMIRALTIRRSLRSLMFRISTAMPLRMAPRINTALSNFAASIRKGFLFLGVPRIFLNPEELPRRLTR